MVGDKVQFTSFEELECYYETEFRLIPSDLYCVESCFSPQIDRQTRI
jgi:hypothetical protein